MADGHCNLGYTSTRSSPSYVLAPDRRGRRWKTAWERLRMVRTWFSVWNLLSKLRCGAKQRDKKKEQSCDERTDTMARRSDWFPLPKDLLILSPLAVPVAVDYLNSKTRDSESLHQPAAIGATGSERSASTFIGDIAFIAHYNVKCAEFMMQCVYFNVQCLHLTSHIYLNL